MTQFMPDHSKLMRDDARVGVLLRAHLQAGQWKSEAWALLDSLAWALSHIAKSAPDVEVADQDRAEFELAQVRLRRVREELGKP